MRGDTEPSRDADAFGAAIFPVVEAVVLRGLPFHEHDRLAAVLEHDIERRQ